MLDGRFRAIQKLNASKSGTEATATIFYGQMMAYRRDPVDKPDGLGYECCHIQEHGEPEKYCEVVERAFGLHPGSSHTVCDSALDLGSEDLTI
jgi:hypothetical protein